MKPKLSSVTLVPVSPFEILVQVTVDPSLEVFPPGFSQLTRYKSEFDGDIWTEMGSDLGSEFLTTEFRLSKLSPHTNYLIEVKLRSSEVG